MNKKEFKQICDENYMNIQYDPNMSKEELLELIKEIDEELDRRTYHNVTEFKQYKKELIKNKFKK